MLWEICLGAKRDRQAPYRNFRYLPDGTKVPKVNSFDDCDKYYTRTIGPKGGIRKTWRVTLYADGRVN